ncbi:MAG TPA: hypothetical protein VGM19_14355 [Armatimonadota bacterium]|jgi:hypothetical protein
MTSSFIDPQAQAARRAEFYAAMREQIHTVVDENGVGKIPQFKAPYREPVWCLPALYEGPPEYVDLANRMAGRYHDDPAVETRNTGLRSGKMFNIFQTNCFCGLYHDYRALLTPAAEEVMRWHVEQACRTWEGSAQPDFVFRGCNDNMPAHATCGLVLAGEALGNEAALTHARWNLRQLRAILARSAWMGEYNSSTYSALTLSSLAKIATAAQDEEIRSLALQLEARLWAEVLLHYHPGTLHQAGPLSRAYSIDYAGHNHSLQLMMWYAFGPEVTGRDLIQSYFHPDGHEVIHFEGCYLQTAAELCTFLDTEVHVPEDLAWLAAGRRYPARLRGRSEANEAYEMGGHVQTETYMEETFSLGTANRPMCGGEQTASLYITYRREAELRSSRDAASVFFKYRTDEEPLGAKDTSADGAFCGEGFLHNQAWCYTSQKDNVALLLCTPNLRRAPFVAPALKMNLIFPAHFGEITASVIGEGPVQSGAVGESQEVVPVSIHAGQVFIHVQPLIPTSLPRRAALRFSRQNEYEALELINYEGEPRSFSRLELGRILNGMVVTVDDARRYKSLEAFHQHKSAARIVDYYFVQTRYFEYLRDDVWFRLVMSTNPPGVTTELIDGRPRPQPLFESNQISADALPFLGERSQPNFPFFPWDQMEIKEWGNSWLIGSRGLPDEQPYSRRVEALYPHPDGPRAESFPQFAQAEEERRAREREMEEGK